MKELDSVLQAFERRSSKTLEELAGLVRIPSVSAPGFDPGELDRTAEAIALLAQDAGLESVEVLRVADAPPYVVAEWMGAGDTAPIVLLYAHYDVQPPGRPEHWLSPPFEPTQRDDARLYGRGVVDDKAGVVLHLAAVRAWLEATGSLPVNLKLLVEGEEEIGSLHLEDFLKEHRERLAADLIVLADTANLETGLPCLTTSLRGIVSVDLTVRALDHPVHSGMWGGPVPDAATALAVLLGKLMDEQGEIAIPGIDLDVPELLADVRAALEALPFDEASFRGDGGMLEGERFLGSGAHSVYEKLWRRPALSVIALEAVPLAQAANQLLAEARARVSVRLAPGQDAERVCDLLVEFLEGHAPWGVEVSTQVEAVAPGWAVDASGPVFEAAHRALSAGFGRDSVEIGCGGSIPFVGPFSEVLGGVPALLLGLEDPICNAHGENESLSLEDFHKAARAMIHLLHELRTL